MNREEALSLLHGGPDGIRHWNRWRQRREPLPDLRHADLQYADLRKANLDGMRLQHTNFVGAALQGASLVRADLNHCNLRWADLRGAALRSTDLRGVHFYGADLRGTDLRHARVRGVCFTGSRSNERTRTDGYTLAETTRRRAKPGVLEPRTPSENPRNGGTKATAQPASRPSVSTAP